MKARAAIGYCHNSPVVIGPSAIISASSLFKANLVPVAAFQLASRAIDARECLSPTNCGHIQCRRQHHPPQHLQSVKGLSRVQSTTSIRTMPCSGRRMQMFLPAARKSSSFRGILSVFHHRKIDLPGQPETHFVMDSKKKTNTGQSVDNRSTCHHTE